VYDVRRFKAIVVLPDHLHFIWSLPDNDSDFAAGWRLIKTTFSRALPAGERISPSRLRKGERGHLATPLLGAHAA
jgi:putative transposase